MAQANSVAAIKPARPSLAKIILSLDSHAAKQQALSHVLAALHIMYARCVRSSCLLETCVLRKIAASERVCSSSRLRVAHWLSCFSPTETRW